ncbi:MAG: hypothetical protein ACT4P9_16950 [Betaproteobacteria bacterium]
MRRIAALVAVLLIGVLASESAFARGRHGHRHGHFGLHLSFPLVAAPLLYYPYRHYYYPPPVYVVPAPPQPQVWIERDSPDVLPSGSWWYYCPDSGAYYPYVGQCPGGWQRVAPQPGTGRSP